MLGRLLTESAESSAGLCLNCDTSNDIILIHNTYGLFGCAERKKLMSIAGIEKVREAESAADKMRKSADDEAAQIVADGKKEAKALLDQAEKDAESEYKAMIAKAEEEAGKIYQVKIDAEQQACEKIKSAAEAKKSSVVDTIVGKVVGSYGNS